MKKTAAFLSAALFFALIFCALIIPDAQAAAKASVSVSLSMEPSHIYESGNVRFNVAVSVTNGGGRDYIQLKAFNINGNNFPISDFIIGNSYYTFTVSDILVEEGDFDTDFEYFLVYGDFSGTIETVTGKFPIKKAKPQLALTRTASPESALPGDIIYFTYTIKNRSDGVFTDVRVDDPVFGVVYEADEIGAGEEVTILKEIVFSRNFTSEPSITGTREGAEDAVTKALSPLHIKAADTGLEVALSSDAESVEPGGAFTLVCAVKNISGGAMTDVAVTCGVIGDSRSIERLESGCSYIFSMAVRPIAARDYSVTVTAKNSDGKTVEDYSETVRVGVAGDVYVDAAVVSAYSNFAAKGIEFSVEPGLAVLTEPGEAVFHVTLKNNAGKLRGVYIWEKSIGEVARLDALAIGDKQLSFTLDVEKTEAFEFVLEGVGENGVPVTVEAKPLEITVGRAETVVETLSGVGALPDSPAVNQAAALPPMGGAATFPLLSVLVIILSLIGICAVFLLFLYIRERYIDRRSAG